MRQKYTPKSNPSKTRLIIGIMVPLAVAAWFTLVEYRAASAQTCKIMDAWVRFYDTPEMCGQQVIDRLTVESGVNGDPEIPRPDSMSVAPAQAKEDGFLPTT